MPRLLETGSTALIRNTAAEQLADVQKQHPEDLFNLLNRVVPFLRSKSWETRVAAAKAVGGIVANAEKYDPNAEDEPIKSEVKAETNGSTKEEDGETAPVKKEENGDVEMPLAPDQNGTFDLATLDIAAILRDGSHLVGAASKELEFKLLSMSPADRLTYQKDILPKRLGLHGPFKEVTAAPSEEIVAQTPGLRTTVIHRIDTNIARSDSIASAASPTGATPTGDQPMLSKRQLNAQKRKQKSAQKNNKGVTVDFNEPGARKPSTSEALQTPARMTPHPSSLKQENSENGEAGENLDDYFSLERKGGDDDGKFVKEFKESRKTYHKRALWAEKWNQGQVFWRDN